MISIAYPKSEPNAVYDVGSEALIGVLRQAPIPFLPMEWRVNFLHPRWEPHRHGGAACIQSMPWLQYLLAGTEHVVARVGKPPTSRLPVATLEIMGHLKTRWLQGLAHLRHHAVGCSMHRLLWLVSYRRENSLSYRYKVMISRCTLASVTWPWTAIQSLCCFT